MANAYIEIIQVENGWTVRVMDYPSDGKRIDARARTFVAADILSVTRVVLDAVVDLAPDADAPTPAASGV